MNLNAWQERLSTRFAKLSEERAGRGNHPNVYALEHGLNASDVAEIGREIHSFLKNSGPARRHYLAWVVYSAEIGYQYSGEEYWETFRRLTPGWDDSFRDDIRDAFLEFHRRFKATRPRGRWAEHFKIICWPITHAILPQDLQRELAQVLYELRGSFTSQLLHDPDELGKHIRDATWNAGARFRKFTEDHLLVGQISTALLLSEEEKENSLILPATLERITKDLDENRRSREWLSYARQRAHQVSMRGLSREGPEKDVERAIEGASHLTARERDVVELGLEPDLLLTKAAPNTWTVRLKLPDLSRLIRRFPTLRNAVANQRCTIAGTEPRVFPRGYFLYGNQDVTLNRWPSSDELLIKFEQPHKDLDYLLTAECLLRPGPTWLFKVSADGTARHIKTGVVKPGSSYVLISNNNSNQSAAPALNSEKTVVKCADISAMRFDVPEIVSKIYSEELESLHLHVSGGLEVAAVGLPAAKWDDAGLAEWVSTVQPLIRIFADFDADGILLNLVGPRPAKLELPKPAWPLLIDLGNLDPGVYELHVLMSRPATELLISGELQFTIREPRTWNGDKTERTAFSVHVSPAAPTLDELWEGHVTVVLGGPRNHQADVEIRFLDHRSEVPIHEQKFGPLELPCDASAWSQAWDYVTSDKNSQNAYDACSECEIVVRSDVGRYVLRAVRESRPLRWIVKQENSGYFLRLEQLDNRHPVAFSRYPFTIPTEVGTISGDPSSGFRVSDDGGLFVASTEEETASVVIPPAIHSLRALSADVSVPRGARSESSLSQIVRTVEVWADARSIGNLFAQSRKYAVVVALKQELIRLLCGDEWLSGEERWAHSSMRVEALRTLVSPTFRYERLTAAMIAKRQQLQTQTITEIVELLETLSRDSLDLPFVSLSRDHGVSRRHWAIEFAFRLLSCPEGIQEWAQQEFVVGLGYLLKAPILCRLARFAFLLSEVAYQDREQATATSL